MKTLALALATMIGGAAMTAHATATVRVMAQEPVSYHDLNLQTESGADALLNPDPVCCPQGLHRGESGPDEAEHQGSASKLHR
jgi:hypothetical protein